MEERPPLFTEGTGGGSLPSDLGCYGEPVPGGGVSFRCGACGEAAAVIRLARSGTPVNMGQQLGEQTHGRDGVVIDYWLGATCWRAVDTDTWDKINAVLTGQRPDPAALHDIDWQLVPFWCHTCRRCYCRGDWRASAVWDGPHYDYTDGVCPAGHRQIIDD